MANKTSARLWVLRAIGILFMGAAVYVAWYSMGSGRPRDFWREKISHRINLNDVAGEFEDQDGKKVTLKDFQGKPVVATFVFKDCNISCPLIMTDLKFFDAEMPGFRDKGVFLIFTFEDHRGKSDELRGFLNKYRIAGDHWRVLTSDAATIRRLADNFELQYNKGEKGNYIYMHSNFFLVADKTGKVKRELRGTEANKDKFVAEVRGAL